MDSDLHNFDGVSQKHEGTDLLILSSETKCNWLKEIIILLFEFYAFLMKS